MSKPTSRFTAGDNSFGAWKSPAPRFPPSASIGIGQDEGGQRRERQPAPDHQPAAAGHLAGARPRFIAIAADGEAHIDESRLPGYVTAELARVRTGRHAAGPEEEWVRVPMTLEGETVGALVATHGLPEDPEPSDVSVLRILANQAAVSLHTSQQYQAGLALLRRAQLLYDEATAQAQAA